MVRNRIYCRKQAPYKEYEVIPERGTVSTGAGALRADDHIFSVPFNRSLAFWYSFVVYSYMVTELTPLIRLERKKRMFERVKKIIMVQLDVDDSQVTLDSSFVDDLGADSLDVVELIMALEQEFNIEIPDEDAEKIITVNDAVQYVTNNIK